MSRQSIRTNTPYHTPHQILTYLPVTLSAGHEAPSIARHSEKHTYWSSQAFYVPFVAAHPKGYDQLLVASSVLMMQGYTV